MSSASVSSSTPSSVLLHSAVQANYHLTLAYPPLFATEPATEPLAGVMVVSGQIPKSNAIDQGAPPVSECRVFQEQSGQSTYTPERLHSLRQLVRFRPK